LNTPEILAIVSTIFTLSVAFLFFRYIYWGVISRRHYWKKTDDLSAESLLSETRAKNMELPCFTIMIPARDEADVIANTVDHMSSLDYPRDKYEIMVITDAKELRVKKNDPHKITTGDIVEQKIMEFAARKNAPVLRHLTVPYDFDGRVGGICLSREVASTKARALNYGLSHINGKTTICSFFDAESRPESKVLLYIAARYLASSGRRKLWQGPVFQVRNFYHLSPINKIIAVYQALAHEWYLPVLMKSIPFLGGTNLHVERELLQSIGGYDHTALSEDLELGVRSYLETGHWPEYIPIVSTEQTPASYKAYYRQRLRWASGHLQVFDKLRAAMAYPDSVRIPLLRTLFIKGHAQWYLYQALVLFPYVFLALTLSGKIDPFAVPEKIRYLLSWLTPLYYSFTFYLFYRFRKYIDFSLAPSGICRYLPALQMAILPIAGILVVLPFSCALILRGLHRQPQVWVKTPRTREISTKILQD
jgi:cellulose synthase/poly-beta-1,6-N-acetylglucosamine synthase-like glycosyltransferase